ncbi:MAG TPA: class II aldolase/adducin family protein [Kofleriaceae bacterium]|nr:class II aldolase/adducin family protein [Kofleriaceae bacterium]
MIHVSGCGLDDGYFSFDRFRLPPAERAVEQGGAGPRARGGHGDAARQREAIVERGGARLGARRRGRRRGGAVGEGDEGVLADAAGRERRAAGLDEAGAAGLASLHGGGYRRGRAKVASIARTAVWREVSGLEGCVPGPAGPAIELWAYDRRMRHFVSLVAAAALALGLRGASHAQPRSAAIASDPRAAVIADVVAANHILADQGVVDGYGHVSIRDPSDPTHFWMARSTAPELVTPADVLSHDLDGNATAPANAKLYSERFIHAEIYRSRPDVMAIVHCHSPSLIPFGVTGIALRPLYHMSAFLGDGVPVFDIHKASGAATDMLVRNAELGKLLAKTLGAHPAVLMRGHGAVIVGRDIQQAVFRSVYTEMNARLQGQAMALGGKIVYLDADEAHKAADASNELRGRAWELWLHKLKEKER